MNSDPNHKTRPRVKVAGTVILYNPGEQVARNIASYRSQVDRLLIIDNSDNGGSRIAATWEGEEHVSYHPNHGNQGVAKALNLAAELALREGFDFLLTMDQDSYAPPGMVEALLNALQGTGNTPVGIIAPTLLTRPGQRPTTSHGPVACETVMTSGSLLDLHAFKAAGPFDESLFIDFVDIEYCLRLRSNDFGIFRTDATYLEHQVGSLVSLPGSMHVTTHAPVRKYYKTRNRLKVWKEYRQKFAGFVRRDRLRFCLELVRLGLLEPDRCRKFRMVWQGYRDYRRGRYGKFPGDAP